MIVQSLLLSNESYTHAKWEYKDIAVGFSRLYYIISGEAYYEEEGRSYPFKVGYLYLTPVKKSFSLYENPESKLLHTYAHIITVPSVDHFTEIPVKENTPLGDAVTLWRKYAKSENEEFLKSVISLLLSCIEKEITQENIAARIAKAHIDQKDDYLFNMRSLSAVVGYSREHITRSFLATYGMTPKQYFNLKRMNAALERLTAGVKVGDVAEELCYASPYSFSKAFKNHFGLSPQNYLHTLHSEQVPSSTAPKP